MTFTATHFSDYVIALSSVEDAPDVTLTDVKVTTYDTTSNPITVATPDTGRTFTVTCANACVVAYTIDNGESYTRMTATKVAGQENTYSFTVDDDIDLTNISIAVALKGDVDLNGTVAAGDVSLLRSFVVNPSSMSALQNLLADVDRNGTVAAGDVSLLRSIVVNPSVAAWEK
jgi:hypothetical protein